MRSRFFPWVRAVAAVVAAGAAAVAHAGAGNGIRLGGSEARLHPFLDLESRYDSNVSYSADNQAVADVVLHVRPGAELKIPGDVAAIEFSGALDWAQNLGLEDSATKDLSKMYANAGFAALFNRRGAVSLRLDNDFRRQVSTTSLAAAAVAVVANTNVLSVSVPWKPGGGALVVTANGQWLVEAYQEYKDDPGFDVADLGYSQFRGGADVQWRFLPRTSALLSGGWFTRVPNESRLGYEASGGDVLAGVTGLLTQRVAATAKVGYGVSSSTARVPDATTGGLRDEQRDTSTFLADVNLEWLPMEALSLRTGYTRSSGIDPTEAAFVSDGVSAGFRLKMADRFAFRTAVRLDRLAFEARPGEDVTFLRLDPTVEGMVGRWLTVGLGYVYSARASSGDLPDYSKSEAFLSLGLTY
jgi:hypothetical protein